MSIYTGTDLANVVAQINKDNPGLPWPINETDFIFGKPAVVASPVAGRNTTIKLTPKSTSKYRGSMDLTYTRIDLSNLFRSVNMNFTRWTDGPAIVGAQVISILNQKYGLNWEASKFNVNGSAGGGWGPTETGAAKPVGPVATNLMYVGSVQVIWNKGKQQLGLDVLTTTELPGATWPGGNDFVADPSRQFRGEFLLAGVDFTEFAFNNAWTALSVPGASIGAAGAATLIAEMNRLTGLNFNTAAYDATTNPLGGMTTAYPITAISLPNATYPNANKPGFAYAKVINFTAHPAIKAPVILYFNL